MKGGKISSGQAAVLLSICSVFSLFSAALHDIGADYGLVHLLSYPAAAVFQAAALLPALLLTRLSGRGISENALLTMGRAGCWVPLLCAAYLLLTAAVSVCSMSDFLVNTAYPGAAVTFFTITMVLAAGYAAAMGIEGIARAALILGVLFLLGLGLVSAGVWERTALLNIRPLQKGAAEEILRGSGAVFGQSAPLLFFVLLSHRIRGKKGKGLFWYLGITAAMQAAVTFFIGAVLGDLANQKAYPLFLLTTIAKVSVFQRMDALYLGVWVGICLIRTSVCFWLCREIFLPFAPGKNGNGSGWMLPLVMAFTAAGALLLSRDRNLFLRTEELLSDGYLLAALLLIPAAVMLAAGMIRGQFRKEKRNAER